MMAMSLNLGSTFNHPLVELSAGVILSYFTQRFIQHLKTQLCIFDGNIAWWAQVNAIKVIKWHQAIFFAGRH